MNRLYDPSHFPADRPRRLRSTPAMRSMVAETSLEPRNLIQPLFVAEGITEPRAISSMPGMYNHTLDSLKKAVEEAASAGVSAVDLFGVPADDKKDVTGSQAVAPDGILNRALSQLRDEFGDSIMISADTCLDEFTDHGHCGVLTTDRHGVVQVDNDATNKLYAQMAVAQAKAGAHIVSPSGMMDGQVQAIRTALDSNGYEDVAILAYSAKYASAFYGPFRDAVSSTLEGDRKTYQQDPRNARESLREVEADIRQGADMVMVKPALPYLDILHEVSEMTTLPVVAYQVSGEYSMITAAAQNGWIDREKTIMESLYSIKRAGADIILTYWATEVAQWLSRR